MADFNDRSNLFNSQNTQCPDCRIKFDTNKQYVNHIQNFCKGSMYAAPDILEQNIKNSTLSRCY